MLLWPLRTSISSRVSTSHSLTVPCVPALAKVVPSPENATDEMSPWSAFKWPSCAWVCIFQKQIFPSLAPLASRCPSGDHATLVAWS